MTLIVTLDDGRQVGIQTEPDGTTSWVAERGRPWESWGPPFRLASPEDGIVAGTFEVRA